MQHHTTRLYEVVPRKNKDINKTMSFDSQATVKTHQAELYMETGNLDRNPKLGLMCLGHNGLITQLN